QLCFNYLGQLDRGLPAAAGVALADEAVGPLHGPRPRRSHLLEVNAGVVEGRLQLARTYRPGRPPPAPGGTPASGPVAAREELIEHCRSPGAGGYVPSDFPLAGLDQPGLDRLLARQRGVEDVYPLSALQQGLLFHSLYAPDDDAYFEQLSCRLEGALDVDAFR